MKPIECNGCPLFEMGQGFTSPFGSGSNGVSLVNSAPTRSELEKGPFTGRGGSVLSKILSKVDSRENFSIRNILQCQPPKDSWSSAEWWAAPAEEHCEVHRRKAKERFHPKVNVALGPIPFHSLTGLDIPISKARGYVFEGLDGVPVVATYHPSFLGKGKMNLIPVVAWDIRTALKMVGQPLPSYPTDSLILYPTPSEFEEFCHKALSSEFIAVDLETPNSRGLDEEELEEIYGVIDRGSMALDSSFGNLAITWPWQEPFTSLFRALMESKVDKVFHNGWDFDLPKLSEVGIVPNGKWQDTMWLFHSLQPTLPRGLGGITPFYATIPEWKSKSGSDPELYSALDAWATARNFEGIKRAMMRRII